MASPPGPILPSNDDRDAEVLARAIGISLPEAKNRLLAQDEVGRIAERRGARVRVDHSSPAGLVVEVLQAPGDSRGIDAREISAVSGVSRAVVRDVPINEAGLAGRVGAAKVWAERVSPERLDAEGDELTGRALITVESAAAFEKLSGAAGRPAFVDVRRGPVARATATIWAGENIDGGALCTLGFGVIKNGVKYTTTAAHSPCSSANVYQYGGTLSPAFTQFFGSSDLSLRSTGINAASNVLWVGSSTRSITAVKSRSTMSVGNFVCHYGRTTLYGCGYIDSKTIAPGYIPSATATYIRVNGCSLGYDLSQAGDSGGPWFNNNTAWGWHTGGSGPNSCGLGSGMFMAANYISDQGASILTS